MPVRNFPTIFSTIMKCWLNRMVTSKNGIIYIYTYTYLETRAASKFWCWSSKTVFHLIAAEISGMRRSLGNKYGFRFWCWNAPFLPMIAPFLPVIAPSLPVQNFHCAVFVELRHVFYIAPFLWTCAWFFCRLGMRPKFWIHESLGIYIYICSVYSAYMHIYNHVHTFEMWVNEVFLDRQMTILHFFCIFCQF